MQTSCLSAWGCLHEPHSLAIWLAPHTRGFGGSLFTQVSSPRSSPCSGMSLLVGNVHSQDTGIPAKKALPLETFRFTLHPLSSFSRSWHQRGLQSCQISLFFLVTQESRCPSPKMEMFLTLPTKQGSENAPSLVRRSLA